jgi:hypothetical protein
MDCYNRTIRKNELISPPDYDLLFTLSHFKKAELKVLFKKYESICTDGLFAKKIFLELPELRFCPFSVNLYEKESSLKFNFDRFVFVASVFSNRASTNEKIKCNLLLDI